MVQISSLFSAGRCSTYSNRKGTIHKGTWLRKCRCLNLLTLMESRRKKRDSNISMVHFQINVTTVRSFVPVDEHMQVMDADGNLVSPDLFANTS